MGVHPEPALEDHCKRERQDPIMHLMSCNRYLQIKRYFHISPHDETYDQVNWPKKMEPLASHLRECYQSFVLPFSNLSFDEMMVLCKGRSAHTIKLPGKPIDQGYTYLFLFYSGHTGNEVSEFTHKTDSFAPLT